MREITLVLLSLVALTNPSHARGLKENFIHPDKLGLLLNESIATSVSEEARLEIPQNCDSGCDPLCISFAKRILNDCGNGNADPVQVSQECLSKMKSYFGSRSGTSSSQDAADAVAYCVSGASPECAEQLYSKYLAQRSGTTSAQDKSESAQYCQNGVTVQCMDAVYPTFSSRSGTTKLQDIADAAAACQRRVR